jgi:elongation of very long chain fatty acids protein 4
MNYVCIAYLLITVTFLNIFLVCLQVSFLHVYHHCTIAWAWWIGLSLMPGGDSYFGALLNSWIHVMMYSYYAMSLLKIPCPWKRYLTLAQLAQFSAVVLYSTFVWTYYSSNIQTAGWRPYAAISIQVWEMVSLFALFSIFYKKSYGTSKTKTSKIGSKDRNSST